ncbi:MAG: hypothetical protein ACREF7_03605 [Candidatus Saccharimonadales bacterium]
METTYFHQQTIDKPLFSDLLWSRPEQKAAAGKLAVIGGSSSGFNSVSETFATASKAGAGTIRVLLPASLKRTLSKVWTDCEFAPSNKSGSFGASALSEWLSLASWADIAMICGDLGKSSETAIVLEHFLDEYKEWAALAEAALINALNTPLQLLDRDKLILVLDHNVLGTLLRAIRYPMAARSDQTIFQLADLLHALTQSYPWAIITEHEQLFFASYMGEVSTTPKDNLSLTSAGTAATVWLMQQPAKPFAAITSGLYALLNPGS